MLKMLSDARIRHATLTGLDGAPSWRDKTRGPVTPSQGGYAFAVLSTTNKRAIFNDTGVAGLGCIRLQGPKQAIKLACAARASLSFAARTCLRRVRACRLRRARIRGGAELLREELGSRVLPRDRPRYDGQFAATAPQWVITMLSILLGRRGEQWGWRRPSGTRSTGRMRDRSIRSGDSTPAGPIQCVGHLGRSYAKLNVI